MRYAASPSSSLKPSADGKTGVLLLQHFLIGTIAALVFAGAVLWFDIASLATLIFDSPDGRLALILLVIGLISTFGPIAMIFGIMENREDRSSDTD